MVKLTVLGKKVVVGGVLAATITVTSCGAINVLSKPEPVEPTPIEAVMPKAEYASKATIVRALNKEVEIVGVTAPIDKRVIVEESKWYGDKTYDLTLVGEFKLGIKASDIEITVEGNTVRATFPKPQLLIASTPFDEAIIHDDVGRLRKDFTTAEEQAIHKQARQEAIREVMADQETLEEAEESVAAILRGLIKDSDQNVKKIIVKMEAE